MTDFCMQLYFDVHRIDGVKPLELWTGFRELLDPLERAALLKNLIKMAIPLVNERGSTWGFEEQARLAESTLADAMSWYAEEPAARLFASFPDPPVHEPEQKRLYHAMKERIAALLDERMATEKSEARKGDPAPPGQEPLPAKHANHTKRN